MTTNLIPFDSLDDDEWIVHGNSKMIVRGLPESGPSIVWEGMAFQATIDPNSKALTIQRRYSFDLDDPQAAIAPIVRIFPEGFYGPVEMTGVSTDRDEFLANRDRMRQQQEEAERQQNEAMASARLGIGGGVPNRQGRRIG